MYRNGAPVPVSQSQLLQFENEFGNYVRVPRMTLETPDGPVLVAGGIYLSESLHQLRIRDAYLIQPPTDQRLIYFYQKLFLKCSAIEAQTLYERAKDRLKSECTQNLSKPTPQQLAFVGGLKQAAQAAMQCFQDFLQPEAQQREDQQRRENDRRFYLQEVTTAVDNL